jgi:soluble lytic murein transglycosylase-like protein
MLKLGKKIGLVFGLVGFLSFGSVFAGSGNIPVPPVKTVKLEKASYMSGRDVIPAPPIRFHAKQKVLSDKAHVALKVPAQKCDYTGDVSKSSWHCGLAAWQNSDFSTAADLFVKAGQVKSRSSAARAGAYYWASRAYTKLKDKKQASVMLTYAYQLAPNSFYGVLAAGGLKEGLDFDWASYPDLDVEKFRLFDVDPALIHAIVRQESRFNANAKSSSGAYGLMQIMPDTAKYIAKRSGIHLGSVADLVDPVVNLNLGQSYIKYLLEHESVDGDLVSLLVAYNAGPGHLDRWREKMHGLNDTLLFVELMPSAQTREYVQHVMVNYWAYRYKNGREMPSIAAISKGLSVSYEQASGDLPLRMVQNKDTKSSSSFFGIEFR